MLGNLYIVATPIGNLEDITNRAIETLKSVDVILCEDTRVSGILLKYFDISKPTVSYHQQSRDSKKEEILLKLLQGQNIALITDAGTPGVSDPGNELIDFLLTADPNIKVIPIPGPSSLTSALSVCGFNVSKFTFVGFLPKKGKRKIFESALNAEIPLVFFESPYRIIKTLEELEDVVGEKRIFIAQELTKMHERTIRGNISEAKEILEKEKSQAGRVRGEIVGILDI